MNELATLGKASSSSSMAAPGALEPPTSIQLFKQTLHILRTIAIGSIVLPKHASSLIRLEFDVSQDRTASRTIVEAASSCENVVSLAMDIMRCRTSGSGDLPKLIQLHSKLDTIVSSLPQDCSVEVVIDSQALGKTWHVAPTL
eukprot:3673276-Pyramimonas_sp.AAC.1